MANTDERNDKAQDDSSKAGHSDKKRVIGEGMNSLDSTQAPLKAETGEPDWDAMTDKGKGLRDKKADK